MLDNTITPSWSIDGVAAPTARELTKVNQSNGASSYVLTTYLEGTVSKMTKVAVSVKTPKASGSSNGVKRGYTTVADQADIVNACGVTVTAPVIFKIESSVPVGLPLSEYKGAKALLIAMIQHATFDKVHVNQEV